VRVAGVDLQPALAPQIQRGKFRLDGA